jgi:hypothetical protein
MEHIRSAYGCLRNLLGAKTHPVALATLTQGYIGANLNHHHLRETYQSMYQALPKDQYGKATAAAHLALGHLKRGACHEELLDNYASTRKLLSDVVNWRKASVISLAARQVASGISLHRFQVAYSELKLLKDRCAAKWVNSLPLIILTANVVESNLDPAKCYGFYTSESMRLLPIFQTAKAELAVVQEKFGLQLDDVLTQYNQVHTQINTGNDRVSAILTNLLLDQRSH